MELSSSEIKRFHKFSLLYFRKRNFLIFWNMELSSPKTKKIEKGTFQAPCCYPRVHPNRFTALDC